MDKSKKTNVIAIATIAVIAAVGGTVYTLKSQNSPIVERANQAQSSTQNTGDVPPKSVAEGKTLTGVIKTSAGEMKVELDGTKAPQGASVFKSLSDKKFFDNTDCHRLTTSGIFVLQCGDPQGDGRGGPGFTWGPLENAPANNEYPAGTIAVARQAGNAYSQGSQFFLVYKDSQIPADQAGGYSVIGKVTSGMDVLDKIAANGTADGSSDGAPKDAVKIESFTLS